MDGPVTVGAQHGKIIQVGFHDFDSARQGEPMMHFAHISGQAWVRIVRLESACLALQTPLGGRCLALGPCKGWIALATQMKEQPGSPSTADSSTSAATGGLTAVFGRYAHAPARRSRSKNSAQRERPTVICCENQATMFDATLR